MKTNGDDVDNENDFVVGTITNIVHRQPSVDTASSTGDRACRQLHGNAHGPADLGEPGAVLSSQVSQHNFSY